MISGAVCGALPHWRSDEVIEQTGPHQSCDGAGDAAEWPTVVSGAVCGAPLHGGAHEVLEPAGTQQPRHGGDRTCTLPIADLCLRPLL